MEGCMYAPFLYVISSILIALLNIVPKLLVSNLLFLTFIKLKINIIKHINVIIATFITGSYVKQY